MSEHDSAEARWEVTPIDGSRWRIRDGACRANDADGLVAYVERDRHGLYDVLWLRRPCPARTRYQHLAHVLADLAGITRVAAPTSGRRADRPTPIAHLSPRG